MRNPIQVRWLSARRAGALAAALALALTAGSAHASFERTLEKMLGRQARDAVESQYQVISDGAAADYVRRMGAELVAVCERREIEYTFKLLDTEQVNAFALPWGYVYVTTGMLRFVDSSDQLAGVMGHEIAHVAQKHSLDAFKKQFWTSLLFGVVEAPATLLTVGKVGATLYLLRYSRKDEQTADRLGAEYAYAAGYDPAQLMAFLRKLEQEHGRKQSTLEVYLSTHPTGERREERLGELPQVRRGDAESALRVGDGFLARRLPNQALLEYHRALDLAPDDAAALAALTRAYTDLGEEALARQALQRARDRGWQGERVALAATPDDTATTAPALDPEHLRQARLAAATWALEMQEPIRRIKDRGRTLDEQVRGLVRRINFTGLVDRPSLTTERLLGKVQFALYLVAETSERVTVVGEGLETISGGAGEAVELAASGLDALAADRAQWHALLQEIADGIAHADERGEEIQRRALQAADLADRAARQLDSALSGMMPGAGLLGRRDAGMIFMGLAEGEVDEALRSASAALEASREAMATLSAWRAQELAWRLSAAYLAAPPPQRPALRSLAVAMAGVTLEQLDAADASLGGGLLRALSAPARPQVAEGPPGAPEQGRGDEPAAQPPDARPDLMLKLILADFDREEQARRQWQAAAE